jgi:hypothetical protein
MENLAINAKWEDKKLVKALSTLFLGMPEIHRLALLEALAELNETV